MYRGLPTVFLTIVHGEVGRLCGMSSLSIRYPKVRHMKKPHIPFHGAALLLVSLLGVHHPLKAQPAVKVQWEGEATVSRSTPTLQVVVNPMLLRGSPIHAGSFDALKKLGADYVRFVPWFPYPHMAVPELDPPSDTGTSWDFSHIDPIVEDFMDATAGHSVVMNFSTIPVWMFQTEKPVAYPADPNQVSWDYNQGLTLRDTSFRELSAYFVRLFSWYTHGGFTDEKGRVHRSGHHYSFPYWEVLNEPDLEHRLSPEAYTRMYDAIVTALKKVSPETKFIGMSLAHETDPSWFTYFLDPAHHRPGVPLEGISYHFYGHPDFRDQPLEYYQYSFFNQADAFLDRVRYIESIRKRLAPHTFTTVNELGNILERDGVGKTIPDEYWNLCGAMYAYLYVQLTRLGIDAVGESQLVGYPTQFPSVSMMNWTSGKPNARYWVLKLLKDNFGPGDRLVPTQAGDGQVLAQAFVTAAGRRLLLVNKRNVPITLKMPPAAVGGAVSAVRPETGDGPPASGHVDRGQLTLAPFEVAVVHCRP